MFRLGDLRQLFRIQDRVRGDAPHSKLGPWQIGTPREIGSRLPSTIYAPLLRMTRSAVSLSAASHAKLCR